MTVGDRVTVAYSGHPANGNARAAEILVAFVTRVYGFGFVCEPHHTGRDGAPVIARLFTEEGTTWCKGESGPVVEALKIAEALI